MKPKASIAFALRRLANRLYTPPDFVQGLAAPPPAAQRRRRKTKFMPKVRRKMAKESRRKNRGKS